MSIYTDTSMSKKSVAFGFSISPSTYCKVINLQSQEELILSPGIHYYIPWDKNSVRIVDLELESTKSSVIEETENIAIKDRELYGWLKLAEGAFKFWDNEIDDLWNNV